MSDFDEDLIISLSKLLDQTGLSEIEIENKKVLIPGFKINFLNLSTIAGYVYKSMDGMGTDELQYASAVAAIHMDLCERNVSERGTQRVFDIFNADSNRAYYTDIRFNTKFLYN